MTPGHYGRESELRLSCSNFAAPAFIHPTVPMKWIWCFLMEADSSYYRNSRSNYRDWDRQTIFQQKNPPRSVSGNYRLDGNAVMVVGNINGEIRLFVNEVSSGLPKSVEFFRGIKQVFTGVLTHWAGVSPYHWSAGWDNQAFLNTGSLTDPPDRGKILLRGVPRISQLPAA
jgi:hypothetical protein